ncbi:hypothetical protein [Variovorax ginsengisoli]|uniref:Lipoprotein n=1 Tax=Variovorax ginsengisoli TaxID=363844 RepID=A0ABT9S9C6_9BURK|nr:hypothetical protein [Variovorax ginsengisoli]MDP9900956.1 hypothetical protein [Variovorax ginsengisoli]
MKKLTMLAVASAAIAECGRSGSPPATLLTDAQTTATAECAALPTAAATSAPAAHPLVLQTIKFNGEDRQYYEYTPSDVTVLSKKDARGIEVVICAQTATWRLNRL